MTALLDLPAIRERAARLSVEEYHRLGELPVELLRGTLIQKMSKSPAHQFYSDRVRKILSGQIAPEWLLRQEGPLTFSDSEAEPDVAVVAGPEERYRSAHPTIAALAVEVAVSSLEIDRVKAVIYAEAGVTEYWIVCPDEKCVEVYRQSHPQGYSECIKVAAPDVLECNALPGVRVDLAALFS
jgi:Uma2 family endonuclease